jgi:3-oxoacyl-[acyl-carrier-protein] synthase III
MTIGIKACKGYIPETTLENSIQAKEFDVEENFLAEKIGMLRLSRKLPSEETSDLAVKAVQNLLASTDLHRDQIECLVLVTQNPDGFGLPHTSAIIHRKLELSENCSVFDLSLGCSGFIHSLAIAKAYMDAQRIENGVIVTADPYSKIINSKDRNTALLFGDAACAIWLGKKPTWTVGPFDFGTASKYNSALLVCDDRRLKMNGREVFNFSAVNIPISVHRVLDRAGLTMDDVDMVLLHQGSRYIVNTIGQRLKVPEKTPFFAKKYGNTVSSSIPLILERHIPDEVNRIVACGFGVGLAWATTILERLK